MQKLYKAKLKGDRLEWSGEAPTLNGGTTDVLVEVLPHAESTEEKRTRGERMAAALQRIADRGGIQSIPDPAAWQREMRVDRSLPGRDD